MPVYIGIVLKIPSDFNLILTEHCFPKIIYIHIGQMFLLKFRVAVLRIPWFPHAKDPRQGVCLHLTRKLFGNGAGR